IEPTLTGDEALRKTGTAVLDELMKRSAAWGSAPIDFYPAFIREDDPTSGFAVSGSPKRFSQAYWAGRNRIGVLVETHSWKDYPTRVRITHQTILALMEMAARDAHEWVESARSAD